MIQIFQQFPRRLFTFTPWAIFYYYHRHHHHRYCKAFLFPLILATIAHFKPPSLNILASRQIFSTFDSQLKILCLFFITGVVILSKNYHPLDNLRRIDNFWRIFMFTKSREEEEKAAFNERKLWKLQCGVYTLISCIYSYNYPPTNSLLQQSSTLKWGGRATQQLLIFPIVEQRNERKTSSINFNCPWSSNFATPTTHNETDNVELNRFCVIYAWLCSFFIFALCLAWKRHTKKHKKHAYFLFEAWKWKLQHQNYNNSHQFHPQKMIQQFFFIQPSLPPV